MKYITGICNIFGIVFLMIIINLTGKHIRALDADYEAYVNKYKTECAAEVAYVANLYHQGDWTIILADALAAQDRTGFSGPSRINAVQRIGTAISFEETNCSALFAFDDDVTAVLFNYYVYPRTGHSKMLIPNIDFQSGTYVDLISGQASELGNKELFYSAYKEMKGLAANTPDSAVEQHIDIERSQMLNNIIAEAMGKSGYADTDQVYIPMKADINLPGINPIKMQTLLVLRGAGLNNSQSTTLAGFTKVQKRQYCVISGPHGKFYCFNDQLPAGYMIYQLVDTELEAAKLSKGQYYVCK